MRICIIGAGTYGSYLARLLAEARPDATITILETGDARLRDEASAGFRSKVREGSRYAALSHGRFFGVGGTSRRWGGQLLVFSENDFAAPTPFLQELVDLSVRHRAQVFRRLGVPSPALEQRVSPALFVKTGVWLGYLQRNLFRFLGVARLRSVQVRTGCRVIRLLHTDAHITGVRLLEGDEEKEESFDHYFLTAGAFEGNRLLLASGLSSEATFSFSDHLSQRAFRILGSTHIGPTDFRFRFRGSALTTRRLVGEVGGLSFFAHPIFNVEFPFFQSLKRVLFQRNISPRTLGALLFGFPQGIAFFFSMLVLRRLYVHGDHWYLQLDLENYPRSGQASLSSALDARGQPGLDVRFIIDEGTDALFAAARTAVREYLGREKVDFEELPAATDSAKYEDTYHPFGMYGSDSPSVRALFERHDNLLVVNTGILPRAGGLNCTAALFPLLEEYVATRLTVPGRGPR